MSKKGTKSIKKGTKCIFRSIFFKFMHRLVFVELTQSGSSEVKDFKVSVSDESIITLELSENSDIYRVYGVSSHGKTGEAVITVVADGVTQEINYKVCNDFVYFFINLWFEICDFFRNMF